MFEYQVEPVRNHLVHTQVPLSSEDGMPTRCALSFDNLTLMPKILFTERITRLGLDRMTEVCAALRVATGC